VSINIIIKKIRSPPPGSLNEDIDYICKSFGYFTPRDKQDTAGKIFRLIVKKTANSNMGLSSDEIAEELSLTRGAIIYHLNNFITAGLVIKENNRYRLRSQSIQKIIEEIKIDIERIMGQMMKIANDIDSKLGNYYR
jgi:predicted transcriptional regulator